VTGREVEGVYLSSLDGIGSAAAGGGGAVRRPRREGFSAAAARAAVLRSACVSSSTSLESVASGFTVLNLTGHGDLNSRVTFSFFHVSIWEEAIRIMQS
jgi:hypothetical protein